MQDGSRVLSSVRVVVESRLDERSFDLPCHVLDKEFYQVDLLLNFAFLEVKTHQFLDLIGPKLANSLL
jgi:hypothetical protein